MYENFHIIFLIFIAFGYAMNIIFYMAKKYNKRNLKGFLDTRKSLEKRSAYLLKLSQQMSFFSSYGEMETDISGRKIPQNILDQVKVQRFLGRSEFNTLTIREIVEKLIKIPYSEKMLGYFACYCLNQTFDTRNLFIEYLQESLLVEVLYKKRPKTYVKDYDRFRHSLPSFYIGEYWHVEFINRLDDIEEMIEVLNVSCRDDSERDVQERNKEKLRQISENFTTEELNTIPFATLYAMVSSNG